MIDSERDMFTVSSIIIVVILIITIIGIGMELVDSKKPIIETMDANNSQIEEQTIDKNQSQTKVEQKNNKKSPSVLLIVISTIVLLPLIGLLVGLFAKMFIGLFIYVLKTIKKIKRKLTARRKEKEFTKRSGYTAYVNLQSTRKHIHEHCYKTDLVLNVDLKLKDIQKMYDSDRDKYDISMYKHQQGFIEMNVMLTKAIKEGVIDSIVIINTLAKMVKYPHNDIVGDGIAHKLIKPVEKEIRIQKDLKQLNKKENT